MHICYVTWVRHAPLFSGSRGRDSAYCCAADLRAGLARRCVGRCRWPRATDAKAGDSGARRTAGSSQIPGKVTLAMSSRRPLQGREELGATPLHVGRSVCLWDQRARCWRGICDWPSPRHESLGLLDLIHNLICSAPTSGRCWSTPTARSTRPSSRRTCNSSLGRPSRPPTSPTLIPFESIDRTRRKLRAIGIFHPVALGAAAALAPTFAHRERFNATPGARTDQQRRHT